MAHVSSGFRGRQVNQRDASASPRVSISWRTSRCYRPVPPLVRRSRNGPSPLHKRRPERLDIAARCHLGRQGNE
jgi:hypothetical protein